MLQYEIRLFLDATQQLISKGMIECQGGPLDEKTTPPSTALSQPAAQLELFYARAHTAQHHVT